MKIRCILELMLHISLYEFVLTDSVSGRLVALYTYMQPFGSIRLL